MTACPKCGESGLYLLPDGSEDPPLLIRRTSNDSKKVWYQTHICKKAPRKSIKPAKFTMGVWLNVKNNRTRYQGPHRNEKDSYLYQPSKAHGEVWELIEVIQTETVWKTIWKKDASD